MSEEERLYSGKEFVICADDLRTGKSGLGPYIKLTNLAKKTKNYLSVYDPGELIEVVCWAIDNIRELCSYYPHDDESISIYFDFIWLSDDSTVPDGFKFSLKRAQNNSHEGEPGRIRREKIKFYKINQKSVEKLINVMTKLLYQIGYERLQ